MGVLCVVGFVGNSVSVVCLHADKSKTPTPLLLIALELADTAFLVTVFLLRVLTSVRSPPSTSFQTPFSLDTSITPHFRHPDHKILRSTDPVHFLAGNFFDQTSLLHLRSCDAPLHCTVVVNHRSCSTEVLSRIYLSDVRSHVLVGDTLGRRERLRLRQVRLSDPAAGKVTAGTASSDPAAGKVTAGPASRWPRVTDFRPTASSIRLSDCAVCSHDVRLPDAAGRRPALHVPLSPVRRLEVLSPAAGPPLRGRRTRSSTESSSSSSFRNVQSLDDKVFAYCQSGSSSLSVLSFSRSITYRLARRSSLRLIVSLFR